MTMPKQPAAEDRFRFQVEPTAETHFSWLRTRLSVERSLMSWLRTAVALIGFGFTIVQFFERLSTMPGVEPPLFPDSPRYIGLALIGAGVAALAVAAMQYRQLIRYLWGGDFARIAGVEAAPAWTPLLPITVALLVIGLVAFFTVLLRLA